MHPSAKLNPTAMALGSFVCFTAVFFALWTGIVHWLAGLVDTSISFAMLFPMIIFCFVQMDAETILGYSRYIITLGIFGCTEPKLPTRTTTSRDPLMSCRKFVKAITSANSRSCRTFFSANTHDHIWHRTSGRQSRIEVREIKTVWSLLQQAIGSREFAMGNPLLNSHWSTSMSFHSSATRKITLAIDLDETLVYCSPKKLQGQKIDFYMNDYVDGKLREYYIYKRPYLDLFMRILGQIYDVVIYTSSRKAYADPIINFIDPQGVVQRRFYRDSCKKKGTFHLKDLRKIVSGDLSRILLLDDNVNSTYYNAENTIMVNPFRGNNSSDEELLIQMPFLLAMRNVQDVRSILRLQQGE